jgi:hypothetical protein
MRCLPNAGITVSSSLGTTSPALTFSIQFTTAGTYNFWIRGWGASGSDDSVYVGVDGIPNSSSISYGTTGLEVVTYVVGDLQPSSTYPVFRGGVPLHIGLVSSGAGTLEFADPTGGTLPIDT